MLTLQWGKQLNIISKWTIYKPRLSMLLGEKQI